MSRTFQITSPKIPTQLEDGILFILKAGLYQNG